MPQVISRQPAWISRSTPAYRLFSGVRSPQAGEAHSSAAGKLEAPGLRTLAHRGSEIFVANGTTIRWADLASMKVDWESKQEQHSFSIDDDPLVGTQYKVLEFTYITEPILQLSISPNQSLLAIVTAHTIHVCLLPEPKVLGEPDTGAVKPTTRMVGVTTHVIGASRIISALWHPLGVAGNCLVTVTADAVLRVWELSMQNRYTMEQPTVAIDLRKLRNANSSSSDLQPLPLGRSEGISYDYLGMDVASACFGGTGAEEELGWAGMTLWIAMTEGDVYALCPLLPTKWQAPSSVLPNLTAMVLAEKDFQETETEKADFLSQYQWLCEQESIPPMECPRSNSLQPAGWIYTRPKETKATPLLQGPFSIVPGDLDIELALADIHVVAPRLHASMNDGHSFGYPNGMPVSLVCLLTQLATVYTCAELSGIHGRWLPETDGMNHDLNDEEVSELIVLGAMETFERSDKNTSSLAGWPTLSPDATSPYDFYVTHSKGVWRLSAEQWIRSLESEMSAATTAGAGFRVNVGAEGSKIQRQKVLSLLEREEDQPSAPLSIHDSDLGNIVLTVYEATPQIAILDSSDDAGMPPTRIKQEPTEDFRFEESIQLPARAAYTPSQAFSKDLSSLKERMRRAPGSQTKLNQVVMQDQIRLSPAMLELMTHDHRLMSEETHKLGLAIADLFTRCNMMQAEFKTQIQRVREIAERVDNLTNNDGEDEGGAKTLEGRLEAARERHYTLENRFDTLRRKAGDIGRPLSDREKTWMNEVDRLEKDLPQDTSEDESRDPSVIKSSRKYAMRLAEVQRLGEDLCSQVKSISTKIDATSDLDSESRPQSPSVSGLGLSSSRGLRVPPDIRKQKMAALENSLERQTALLDATMLRLENLGIDL